MDEPRVYHTKWSKSARERQIYYIAYMWNIKKWYKSTHKKHKLADIESKLIAIKGERGDQGDILGVCDYQIQTTIYKINNKGNLGVWFKIYTVLYIK